MRTERRGTGPRATIHLPAVLITTIVAVLGAAPGTGAQEPPPRLAVTIQPDQAEAILGLLELRASGEAVPETAWEAVFATEGYRRMMDRERSMDERLGYHRGITDTSFRQWAESDSALDDLAGRRAGLEAWTSVDLDRAATMALDYLLPHASLRGTIYPLYREQQNSFVHDLGGERPAIFMYLDNGTNAPGLEHVLAHELHHVGLMAACPRGGDADILTGILGGFGEGLAVDMAAFEAFADSVLAGDLTPGEAGQKVGG